MTTSDMIMQYLLAYLGDIIKFISQNIVSFTLVWLALKIKIIPLFKDLQADLTLLKNEIIADLALLKDNEQAIRKDLELSKKANKQKRFDIWKAIHKNEARIVDLAVDLQTSKRMGVAYINPIRRNQKVQEKKIASLELTVQGLFTLVSNEEMRMFFKEDDKQDPAI